MATYTITIRDEAGGRVGVTAMCVPAVDDPVGAPSPAEIETEWAMDMLQVKDPQRRAMVRIMLGARAKAGGTEP